MYPTLYTFRRTQSNARRAGLDLLDQRTRIGSVMTRRGEWPPPADSGEEGPAGAGGGASAIGSDRQVPRRSDLSRRRVLAENLLTLEAIRRCVLSRRAALRGGLCADADEQPRGLRRGRVRSESRGCTRYVLWKPFFDRMDFCDVPAYPLGQRLSRYGSGVYRRVAGSLRCSIILTAGSIYSAWGRLPHELESAEHRRCRRIKLAPATSNCSRPTMTM